MENELIEYINLTIANSTKLDISIINNYITIIKNNFNKTFYQLFLYCILNLSVNNFKIFFDSIYNNIIFCYQNRHIYNSILNFFVFPNNTLEDKDKIKNALYYLIECDFIPKKLIDKNIYFYTIDNVWFYIKDFLSDKHFINEGRTLLTLSFENIPLFDYLLCDAIKNNLWDPEYNTHLYYINNKELLISLEYNMSISMKKNNDFKLYILSRFPVKYKYLKNLYKISHLISKNNIKALQDNFETYDKFLTSNTRLDNNRPMIEFVETIEMFYYLYHKGANINNTTVQYIGSNLQYTNIVYYNIYFAVEHLEMFSMLGCDLKLTKRCCRSIIRRMSKNSKNVGDDQDYKEYYKFCSYIYNKVLSKCTRFIKAQNKIVTLKLHNIFCKDLINNILTFV